MASPNTILLRGNQFTIGKEAVAAAAGILPGHFLMLNSSGQVAVQAAIESRAVARIARGNEVVGSEIDIAYLNGDNVLYSVCMPGVEVYALLPANAAAVIIGSLLALSGDGTLRKYTLPTVTIGTTTAALTYTSRSPGPRQFTIVHVAAGTALVTVVGNTISVTPATGANTADAVKTQIEANAAANALVTVISGGGGAPIVSAGAVLQGVGAEEPFAVALEAVDNSANAAVARIRAQLM